MKVAFFSSKPYDKASFPQAKEASLFDFRFFKVHLDLTTVGLTAGFDAVCVFVNDDLSAEVLAGLSDNRVRYIALRCAGYNNVNLSVAAQRGLKIVRVPAYSPHAVAEHALALIMALNRKTHRAHNRVHEGNFALDGLLGFDVFGKTVGIVGTGRIGAVFANIMKGMGCELIAYDPYPNSSLDGIVEYVGLDSIWTRAEIISLHCPLTPESHHLIDDASIGKMKAGVMLINTSRGALIDTKALIKRLKSSKIGWVGLDVYEEEADLFFEDLSNQIIQDDVFARLMTFPNVMITGHQAFFTEQALESIAETTLQNLLDLKEGGDCPNEVAE